MMRVGAVCALLLALGCAVLPLTAAPRQNFTLHLPFVQRGAVSFTEADLLRKVGAAGFAHLDDDCGWEAGVLATGWAKLWEKTGDEHYWNWLKLWVDGCLQRNASISHVNDLPLAYAAIVLYARVPDAVYLALAQAGADYIFNHAPRTPDGGLIHLDNMVWDDTLVVAIPFLLKMGNSTGETRYLDEAILQIQVHAAHLQDVTDGLYHHAWSAATRENSGPFYWGRGNGWTLWAQAEVLAVLDPSDVRYAALAVAFRRQATALVARQAKNGMWHTIITRSDFYVETSATALIAAALDTAAKTGVSIAGQAEAASAGRRAVWQRVTDMGLVSGVSGPTGPMDQEAAYNAIPIAEYTLYGQGTALLAGAALLP